MDFGFFKRHPYITGGVILVGGVIFISLSGWFSGGSQQAYAVPSGPSDASIAANAQWQMAQLSATTKLESDRISSATAMELASLSKELEEFKTSAGKDVALAQVDLGRHSQDQQLAAILANTNAALENARINAGLQQSGMAQQFQFAMYNAEAQREAKAYDYYETFSNNYRDDVNTGRLIELLAQQRAA